MNNQSFISQWWARLSSETPIFFKKILAISASIGALGLTLKGIDLTALHLPWDLGKVSEFMIAVGAVGTLISKSATTNPDLQAQGGSNVVANTISEPPQSTELPSSPPIPNLAESGIKASVGVNDGKSISIDQSKDFGVPTFTTDDKQ
jgi:hypothetical protein